MAVMCEAEIDRERGQIALAASQPRERERQPKLQPIAVHRGAQLGAEAPREVELRAVRRGKISAGAPDCSSGPQPERGARHATSRTRSSGPSDSECKCRCATAQWVMTTSTLQCARSISAGDCEPRHQRAAQPSRCLWPTTIRSAPMSRA